MKMRDGWVETNLVDAVEVLDRFRKPINSTEREGRQGDIPYYGANGQTGWIDDCIFDEELVLLGEDAIDFADPNARKAYLISGPSWVNNHAHVLRVNPEKVYSYFLAESLNKVDYSQYVSFGTRSKLTQGSMNGIRIFLPPLSEQKRIVDLISSVDSYVEALKHLIISVRSASNAQLEKIVSNFSDDWAEVSLGDVLDISRGGSPRPIQDYLTESQDGVNWVKIADATRSEKYIYSTLQRIKKEGVSRSREVFSGDFILSNSMSFGRPYIMRIDGCIHDGWLLLSKVSNNFDEDFLYNLLNSDYVQRQFESLAAGSGVRNLNIEVVKKVKVRIPSRELQKQLASVINEFDEFILKLNTQLDSATKLRNSVLSDVLSGKHVIPASYDQAMGAA
jgi:type I restriction enzyme S subunit